MEEYIGKKFNSLTILDVKYEYRAGRKRKSAYCYCEKYNRKGWSDLDSIKNGHTKTGRSLKRKEYKECESIEEFLQQFCWCELKNGYQQAHYSIKPRKHVLKHKLAVETILGVELTEELEVDHIDRNPRNNLLSNLRVVCKYDNMQNTSLKTNTGLPHISKCKMKSSYNGREFYSYEVYYFGKRIGGSIDLEKALKIREDYKINLKMLLKQIRKQAEIYNKMLESL